MALGPAPESKPRSKLSDSGLPSVDAYFKWDTGKYYSYCLAPQSEGAALSRTL